MIHIDLLTDYIIMGDVSKVKWCVANGVDVDGFNTEGKPPLIVAIYEHNKEIVKILVEAGADVNIVCDEFMNNETTPILAAIESKNKDITRFLIGKGAILDGLKPYLKKLFKRPREEEDELCHKVKKLRV